MSVNTTYSLRKEDGQLIFTTPSYMADKGSVLHEGIYNNEFASMLSAMAVCGSLYAVLAFNLEMTVIYYISLIILFMIQFVLFRKFIFREKELKAVFDRVKKKSLSLSLVFSVPEQKISLFQLLRQLRSAVKLLCRKTVMPRGLLKRYQGSMAALCRGLEMRLSLRCSL